MLRLPFLRSIPQVTRAATLAGARTNATGAPEKIEVFVDNHWCCTRLQCAYSARGDCMPYNLQCLYMCDGVQRALARAPRPV